MGAGRAFGQDRRACRFDGDDLDGGILLLEVRARARHRAAGADARDEDVDRAVGVRPDFGTGRGLMDRRIRRVDELAGQKAVRHLVGEFLRLRDGALHALRAVGQDELRPVGLHEQAALDAHGLGHRDDDLVPARGGHGSEADAGIAGGGFDDRGARADLAARLGIVEHGFGDAVFDRTGRIEILELAEHAGLQALLRFDALELEERRIAYELVNGCVDGHGSFLSRTRRRVVPKIRHCITLSTK